MLYIDQHKHIKNRADFFRTLAEAIQASNDLLARAPGDGSVTSILRQLETIRTWTDNGRDPTKEERWKTKTTSRIWSSELGAAGARSEATQGGGTQRVIGERGFAEPL